jgi:hydroxyacylglutathione hydrolase
MLEIVSFVLGPVMTNTYLIADTETRDAAVIDPAWEGEVIVEAAQEHGWMLGQVWVTHAHFDHIGGVPGIVKGINPPPVVTLHPDDQVLWDAQGGAPFFGIRMDPIPEPTAHLQHGQILCLGGMQFEVRHAPGHSPGHVIFYCAAEKVVFSGDTLFWGSIGRTDLPGGDYETLIHSIQAHILSLPDEIRVLAGHGEETSVGQERRWNPFLS